MKLWFYFKLTYLSFCKCLKPSTNEEKEKEKIFKFIKNYLSERLDVVYYIKTLDKIERMKLIMFNTCQNLSFEFLK